LPSSSSSVQVNLQKDGSATINVHQLNPELLNPSFVPGPQFQYSLPAVQQVLYNPPVAKVQPAYDYYGTQSQQDVPVFAAPQPVSYSYIQQPAPQPAPLPVYQTAVQANPQPAPQVVPYVPYGYGQISRPYSSHPNHQQEARHKSSKPADTIHTVIPSSMLEQENLNKQSVQTNVLRKMGYHS
jgi:hypothetical protein